MRGLTFLVTVIKPWHVSTFYLTVPTSPTPSRSPLTKGTKYVSKSSLEPATFDGSYIRTNLARELYVFDETVL